MLYDAKISSNIALPLNTIKIVIIKIKIKSTLQNITENTIDVIETTAIKNKNKITFIDNNTSYRLLIDDNKVTIIRESNEFNHNLTFINGTNTISNYLIKEYNSTIPIEVKTTNLFIQDNIIEITYEVIDNKNKYLYKIEMSDK